MENRPKRAKVAQLCERGVNAAVRREVALRSAAEHQAGADQGQEAGEDALEGVA